MTAAIVADIGFKVDTKALKQLKTDAEAANEAINKSSAVVKKAEIDYKRLGKVAGSALKGIARTAKQAAKTTAAGVTAIGAAFVLTANSVKEFNRQAKTIGISVEELSKLQYAAQQVGVDSERASDAILELGIRATEAAKSGGEIAAIFKLLNIDVQSFSQLNPAEQVRVWADAMAGANQEVQKLAGNALGDSIRDLIPLWQQGAAGVEAYGRRVEELGGVKTQAQVDEFLSAQAVLVDLQTVVGGVGREFLVALSPAIKTATNALIELLNNREKIDEIAKAIREGAVTAFEALRDATKFVVDNFDKIVIAAGAFVAIRLAVDIATLAKEFKGLAIAMAALAANPVTLALLAIAGSVYTVNEAIDNYNDNLKSAGLTTEQFEKAVKDARETTEGWTDGFSVDRLQNSLKRANAEVEALKKEEERLVAIQKQLVEESGKLGAVFDRSEAEEIQRVAIEIDSVTGRLVYATAKVEDLDEALKNLTPPAIDVVGTNSVETINIKLKEQQAILQQREALLSASNNLMFEGRNLLSSQADIQQVLTQAQSLQVDLSDLSKNSGSELLTVLANQLAIQNQLTAAVGKEAERRAKMKENEAAAESAVTNVNALEDTLNASVANDETASYAERLAAQTAILDQEMEKRKAIIAEAAAYGQLDPGEQGELETKVVEERNAKVLAADRALREEQLSNASDYFSQLAGLSAVGNKKLAAIGKAAAISEATINGVLAVSQAYTKTPYPFNIPLAAAMGAIAAANVAKIAAVPLAKGGVLDSPQIVGSIGGRPALAGEAGPEAVLPLQRGADGRLGVSGGGGVSVGAVSVTINGNATASDVEAGVYQAMQRVATEEIASSKRVGNINNPYRLSSVF